MRSGSILGSRVGAVGGALVAAASVLATGCAHAAPPPAAPPVAGRDPAASSAPGDGEAAPRGAPRRVLVTGSRIPQAVDTSTGLPATISPTRIYGRSEILGTGKDGDLGAALQQLDPSIGP